MPSSSTPARKPRSAAPTILLTALVVGTLDAAAAIVFYLIAGGKTPAAIFRFIASGVFGRKPAYSGGPEMIVWGVLFHFLIACVFTLFFFACYRRVGLLRKNPVVVGPAYGLAIWFVMNLAVLPLSKTPPGQFRLPQAISGALVLMSVVGSPIAMSAHRFFGGKTGTTSPAATL